MKPAYRLEVNGQNITPAINALLVDLTLEDERRDKADQLDITLDDSQGTLEIPPKGAKVKLWLGFDESLVFKGVFTVDECEHTGPPDQLIIRAKSASFSGTLNQKREQSWHLITLGDMLRTIAKRNGLTPAISKELDSYFIGHLDQTNESDISFVTRIAPLHDAVANVKADHLIFTTAGSSESASGQALTAITLDRSQCSGHTYSEKDRPSNYTGVQANWNNTQTGQQENETAGKSDKLKVLQKTYPNQADAQQAAKSEWAKIQRLGKTLQLELAVAVPTLGPEIPVTVSGYKKQINALKWLTEKVTHKVTDDGYTMSVEMESN
jgi:phage protein D